jgi:hypothetical protein
MRAAVGEGEERSAGSVKAIEGVGGGGREVNDAHRLSSQSSLSR